MAKNVNFKEISAHDAPEKSPGFLLWQVSTHWRSSIEDVLKSFDLTHPQFVIMASLGWLTRNKDHVTQAAIGKLAGLDPNTTSQILRGLENKGLIKREFLTDARAKNPVLTEKGVRVLSTALPAVEKADEAFFEVLTPSKRQQMIQIFRELGSLK